VLENIFDPLNVSAVMRSCDAVGIREIFVVYTQPYLQRRGLRLGKKTSAGTFKWMDVYVFDSLEECLSRVKSRYGRVLATQLSEESPSLYSLELHHPTALLFGNEDEGVSPEALRQSDGYFAIPQAGFAESLNISVSCAVSLYEAYRQRAARGAYTDHPKLTEAQQQSLYDRWTAMIKNRSMDPQSVQYIDTNAPAIPPIFVERDPGVPDKKNTRPHPLTRFKL
jgi:tRNA (guanosine-2'-O-)-methyltransferase